MSDIKLCQNMSIENISDTKYIDRKCLKIYQQICQTLCRNKPGSKQT